MLAVSLYRLATTSYYAFIRLASLFNSKAKLFVTGRRSIFSVITERLKNEDRKRIWIHCASLGEFEQGRPIIERLKDEYPSYAIVLTFFSPSGYEVRKNYIGGDHIFYLPVDTPGNARSFLDVVQPSLAVFIKYEFWYYYLTTLKKRGVQTLLVSAVFRSDQPFFKWYGGLQRNILSSFTEILVQDATSLQLLSTIGINASIAGDTRFDRVIKVSKESTSLERIEAFCKGSNIIVAGSTWPADEQFFSDLLPLLMGDWRLILVPHEIGDQHISDIETLFEGHAHKWSDNETTFKERVLIIDTIGLLSKVYRYGNVAWIGGGFGKDGVHNVLEAAVYGVACFWGPEYAKYREAVQLIEGGGAMSVKDAAILADILTHKHLALSNMGVIAKEYVMENAGATDKVFELLHKLLH